MSGGIQRGYGGGLDTRLADLERKFKILTGSSAAGTVASMGTFSLATGATSTVKTDANITASSLIFIMPTDAGGWSADAGITGITPAAGSFTIAHSNSTLTRTFNYIAINPA